MKEKIADKLTVARLYLNLLKQGCTPSQLPLIINVGIALTQIEATLAEKGDSL